MAASTSSNATIVDEQEMNRFSRQALSVAGRRDESEFVFFYGHNESKLGDIAMLSNWYYSTQGFVDEQRHIFHTNEHYMMYRKAILFDDAEMAQAILTAEDSGTAKKLGRNVRGFQQSVWNEHKLQIVVQGCMLKFHQCKYARRVLLATGTKILVEAAPRDRVWGIGMGKTNPSRFDPNTWRGQNLLGQALMIVRHNLASSG